MADATTFNSWNTYTARVMRGELSAPSSTAFYMILTNGTTISRTSSMSTIAGAEISSAGGYTRKNVNFATAGSVIYNTGTNRAEIPAINVNVAASGASITYDTVVVVAGANSTIANTTGEPVFFISLSPQTIGDGTEQTIQIEGWGFANIGSADGV